MGGEPGVDGGGVLRGELRRGFLQHVHEPVDFDGDGGVSDVVAGGHCGVGAEGVDDGMSVGREHDEVGVAGGGAAEMGAEVDGAGGVVVLSVGGLFADVESFDDEGFVHDGSDGGVGDEVLEHVAGTAPGGAEGEQDVLVLGGGGGAGLREDLVGAGLGRGLGDERCGEKEECGEDGGGTKDWTHDGVLRGVGCVMLGLNHYEGMDGLGAGG